MKQTRHPGFRHASLALALAALLAAPFASAAPPAGANHAPEHDPGARVLVLVKRIHVLNDHDGWLKGDGELNYVVFASRYGPSCGAGVPCQTEKRTFSFGASSGSWREIDEMVPGPRVEGWIPNTGVWSNPQSGIPLFSGETLKVAFGGHEDDAIDLDDGLAYSKAEYTEAQNWGLGSHTASTGDYAIEYEIIRAPLPDLRPLAVRAGDYGDGEDDIFCATIENRGAKAAGSFHIHLYVVENGQRTMPPGGHLEEAPGLGAGAQVERCIRTSLTPGKHQLAVTVDEHDTLPEMDEANNGLTQLPSIQHLGQAAPGSFIQHEGIKTR